MAIQVCKVEKVNEDHLFSLRLVYGDRLFLDVVKYVTIFSRSKMVVQVFR